MTPLRVAVLNETSAADRNEAILAALSGRGHEILNAGMTRCGAAPELTYIHTGFLAALLLGSGRVDFVVGGCGTGQGFLNAAMQYPGVACGLLASPLDAWLFARINGGNCVSLPLNEGWGWAADVQLRMLFDALFSAEFGCGYPTARATSQAGSRALLREVSHASHRSLTALLPLLPDAVVGPALAYPGIRALLDPASLADRALAEALERRFGG
jgi:ribose 5-phosphate isomerase RpiB